MYIEPTHSKNFKPFSIVIETPEEAKHLIYKLCFAKCATDPKGIEVNMRNLIIQEMNSQGIDLSTYVDEEAKLHDDYIKEHIKPPQH